MIQKRLLQKEDLHFSYRDSFIKHNKNVIITNIWLQLAPSSTQKIEDAKKIYSGHIAYRNEHHPVEFPSCGSVFKNIVDKEKIKKIISVWADIGEISGKKWHNKIAMGYVINRLGFSGYQRGGAQVSKKHANYIINKKNATFSDVYSIIQEIQHTFSETFGFIPETEVEIIPS